MDLLQQVGLYDHNCILYDMYEPVDRTFPNADDCPVDIQEIETYDHRPTLDLRYSLKRGYRAGKSRVCGVAGVN